MIIFYCKPLFQNFFLFSTIKFIVVIEIIDSEIFIFLILVHPTGSRKNMRGSLLGCLDMIRWLGMMYDNQVP